MSGFEVRRYPEKSWSISKMKVIDSCFREYFYTYYGSHNGWLFESSEEAKIAWRLKKLTNIWLMFGKELHGVIKEVIENKRINFYEKEKLQAAIRNRLNKGVSGSSIKVKTGEWDEYPKGEMLQEYYYDGKLNEEDILEVKNRIERCTESFLNSKTFQEILTLNQENILEIDEEKFEFILVHGVKVYALIDALYIDNEGNYIIVDWKTGKESDIDREQILVYALYVMQKYDVEIDKIRGRVEYLLSGENEEFTFDYEDLNHILHRIGIDLNVIDAFLLDKERNEPKEKEFFSMCENTKKCNKCKFRKLCYGERGLYWWFNQFLGRIRRKIKWS